MYTDEFLDLRCEDVTLHTCNMDLTKSLLLVVHDQSMLCTYNCAGINVKDWNIRSLSIILPSEIIRISEFVPFGSSSQFQPMYFCNYSGN